MQQSREPAKPAVPGIFFPVSVKISFLPCPLPEFFIPWIIIAPIALTTVLCHSGAHYKNIRV